MIRPRRLAVCCAAIIASTAGAQQASLDGAASSRRPLFVGTARDERIRFDELKGGRTTLVRSASSSFGVDSASLADVRYGVIAGYGELVWNSGIPFSLNDGALWAGRGTSFLVGGGFWTVYRNLHIVFAPHLSFAENQQFALLPGSDPTRNGFASPWLTGALSADAPVRFGAKPIAAWSAGESSLWLRARGIDLGVSTESQWWGPGIRNAILISNNAGGFPHAFVRTATPAATRIGAVEAKWIAGALSESLFFDRDGSNNLRAMSGAVVTLIPSGERNLTVGLGRVVYSPAAGGSSIALKSFDAVLRNGRSASGDSVEQLTSVFGRWRMPTRNAEVYGEWSRMVLPASFRSFLQMPQFAQGFTVGAQWLPQISGRDHLRIQLEFTNLEQSTTSSSADTMSFYTSTTVAHGFTQRGQIIGAAIGSGSQSQWLAFDWLRQTRSVGLFLARIRWNTDAYYLQPNRVSSSSYDVSVFGGVRGTTQLTGRDVAIEVTRQRRLNFLFQNALYGYSDSGAFDKENVTFRLRFF